MTNYPAEQQRRPAWLIPFAFLIVALVALALILLLVAGDDSSDSTSATDGAEPATTVADREAPETATENPCSSFTETSEEPFLLCDSGPAVEQIQIALTDHGFPVDADGYYGPDTEAAVIAFQQSRGLEADGVVGPDTIAALNE